MKTMIDVKHVGSVRSIRHVMTKTKGGAENMPYLSLYVHQMNRYKLEKERRALLIRLEEIDKQIGDINMKCSSLRPEIMSALGDKPKKGRSREKSEGNGRRRVVKKLKVNY